VREAYTDQLLTHDEVRTQPSSSRPWQTGTIGEEPTHRHPGENGSGCEQCVHPRRVCPSALPFLFLAAARLRWPQWTRRLCLPSKGLWPSDLESLCLFWVLRLGQRRRGKGDEEEEG